MKLKAALFASILLLLLSQISFAAGGGSSNAYNGSKLTDQLAYPYTMADLNGGVYLFTDGFSSLSFSTITFGDSKVVGLSSTGSNVFTTSLRESSNTQTLCLIADNFSKPAAVYDGYALVKWIKGTQLSNNPITYEVFVSKINRIDGSIAWTQVIGSIEASNGRLPNLIVPDQNGGAFVFYKTTVGDCMYVKTINSSGTVTDLGHIDIPNTPLVKVPNNYLAVQGSKNNAWLVWTSVVGNVSSHEIVDAVSIDAAGTQSSVYNALENSNGNAQKISLGYSSELYAHESIASDGKGGFILCWSSDDRSGDTSYGYYMRALRLDSSGTRKWTSGTKEYIELKASVPAAYEVSMGPFVAFDTKNNKALFTWTGLNALISQAAVIFGRLVDLNGTASPASTDYNISGSGLHLIGGAAYDGSDGFYTSYGSAKATSDQISALTAAAIAIYQSGKPTAEVYVDFINLFRTVEVWVNVDHLSDTSSLASVWSKPAPICRVPSSTRIPMSLVQTGGKAFSYWFDTRDIFSTEVTSTTDAIVRALRTPVYGGYVGDAAANIVSISAINGRAYTSGGKFPYKDTTTIEGTVTHANSSITNRYSTIEVKAGSTAITGEIGTTTSGVTAFTATKALAAGNYSLIAGVMDDYLNYASTEGTFIITNEAVTIENVYFEVEDAAHLYSGSAASGARTSAANTNIIVSAKPRIMGSVVLNTGITPLKLWTAWDGGAPVAQLSSTSNFTKQGDTNVYKFSFKESDGPANVSEEQSHAVAITILDSAGNVGTLDAVVKIPVLKFINIKDSYETAALSPVSAKSGSSIKVAFNLSTPGSVKFQVYSPTGQMKTITANVTGVQGVSAKSNGAEIQGVVGYNEVELIPDEPLSRGIYPYRLISSGGQVATSYIVVVN